MTDWENSGCSCHINPPCNYCLAKQICAVCDEPTGYFEDEGVFNDDGEPICEKCDKENPG